MTESIAEGLSVAGLAVGFPLLLLAFMVSLEKLESWGLREHDLPGSADRGDRVDAAVEAMEQLSVAARSERESASAAARAQQERHPAVARAEQESAPAATRAERESAPAGRSRD